MSDVGRALWRSLQTLARGRVWLLVFWPAAAGLLVCVGLALFFLEQLIAGLVEQPPFTWLAGWGAIWLAKVAAAVGGWLLILSAAFVVAMVLAAIFVMPLLLDHVAGTDYAELERRGKDSFSGAVWNSLSAVLLFFLGWLLTLPLWLLPGLAMVLPLFWMAWLTRRTFAYDALAVHAGDAEWRALRRRHAWPMLLLGLTVALLAHIPVLGLLTPTLAALAYTHYCLEALRRERQRALPARVVSATLLEEKP